MGELNRDRDLFNLGFIGMSQAHPGSSEDMADFAVAEEPMAVLLACLIDESSPQEVNGDHIGAHQDTVLSPLKLRIAARTGIVLGLKAVQDGQHRFAADDRI